MSSIITRYASSNVPTRAVRRGVFQPAFIAAAAILLLAAIGLNGAVEMMRLHFKKLPVPLREPLIELPTILGKWVLVSKDKPLDKEMEDGLQTSEYLFRHYVDSSALRQKPEAILAEFANKTAEERDQRIAAISRSNPDAVILLGVTHYTDKADTVAHIPERCYTADGYTAHEITDEQWSRAFRLVSFESRADSISGGRACNVAYGFQVNGQWTSSSDEVRRVLQDLTCKYAYYAKVEMKSDMPDRKAAAAVMQRFALAAAPEIEKLLPNWNEYKNRK